VANLDGTLHVEGATVASTSDITAKWNSLGGSGGSLGAPVSAILATPVKRGYYQHFQGGSIYSSQGSGTHVIKGAIRTEWARLGWENSSDGFPVTDEVALRGGAYNHFTDGSIYFSPATGAHTVRGLIRDKWAAMGWETSCLGYPATDEITLPGGAFNHFAGGSVYWSPATGAHTVRGAIRDRWASVGWENGRLGYPTSDEYAVTGGRRSNFSGGSITWTPTGGAVVTYR
jgi:uncharacterized protein with LGFP repeats